MKKTFIDIKNYEKNIFNMLIELRLNNGNPLHQFHYHRLMAEGIDDLAVVKMLFHTATMLEIAYEKGIINLPDQIEQVYLALPKNDPTNKIESLLYG